MEPILANINWYSSVSSQEGIPPRCPYANVDRCPDYYQSLSLLGTIGITTAIQESEEKRLLKKWENSEHWPKVNEHAPSIWDFRDSKSFSNFCPEVAFDVYGLFASELHPYADEIDIHVAHKQLGKQGAPATDWRWQWSHINPLHYSECRMYSQLVSTNVVGTDKIDTKEIIEFKLGMFGFFVNMKELVKRLWKWVYSHRVN